MNVAVIGNYVPRQCGIATFTTDLVTWMSRALGENSSVFVVAMNDRPEGYDYPSVVRFEINANHPRDYHRAADFINLSGVDIICLQHEFGIFGGPFGILVSDTLKELRKPVVTTVHTVLPDPEPVRREALIRVAEHSRALIVMSKRAIEFLEKYYGIPNDNVFLIHHGVPDRPFSRPDEHKAKWGLQGKTVLLNFGLLSRRKGIEYAIAALPRIVEKFPEVVFVVVGATHPPIKRKEGEKYRFFLKRMARELGVEERVIFYDRFVTLEELIEFLCACDIYLTPYIEKGQIVSGTLAYAVALGRPVVSTKYYYAEELLSDERGILVDFLDSEGIADAVISLLSDPEKLENMRLNCYEFGRRMIWKEIAKDYLKLFESVLAGWEGVPFVAEKARAVVSIRDLPAPKLDYLARLTDKTGVLHASIFDIPDRSKGYTTEDNSLALAVAILANIHLNDPLSLELARTYLAFLKYMLLPDGRFHNFLRYDGSFADDVGGDECQGKALAALGLTVALSPDDGIASLAKNMFDKAVLAAEFSDLRATAFAVCGCFHYLTRFSGAGAPSSFIEKASSVFEASYGSNISSGWRWFEDTILVGNGILSRACLLAYRSTEDEKMRDIGLESLDFLTKVSYNGEFFDFVGDQGWYPRGGRKARFNQLCAEASSLVDAYVDAFIITGDDHYLELARAAMEWYFGRNLLNEPLYEFATGSCSDGITSSGLDPNRSASSIIHFLLALLRITTAIHVERAESEEAKLEDGKT